MTPFGSTVMSPMEENGLAPSEGGGGSESSLRVKADWNCLLQMLAFSLEIVLRIPFSLSDVKQVGEKPKSHYNSFFQL